MRASATLLLLASLTLACSSPGPEPKQGGAAGEGAAKEPTAATGAAAATGAKAPTGEAAATGAAGDLAATGETAATGTAAAAYDRVKLEGLGPVGVEFCDAYIEAYRKCIIFTVPEAEKAAHANTLIHEHENWARTKAGAAEVAATALEVGCRSAQAQAAQKTQALNCAWPS